MINHLNKTRLGANQLSVKHSIDTTFNSMLKHNDIEDWRKALISKKNGLGLISVDHERRK